MSLLDYQQNALRTEKLLPTVLGRLAHAALGFITETGEIATEVKRMSIYGKPLDAERRTHIAEEVGDVMWYLAIASDAIGKNVFRGLMTDLRGRSVTLETSMFELSTALGKFTKLVRIAAASDDADNLTAADFAVVSDHLAMIAQPLVDIADIIEVPLDQICDANIAKLRERFPDAYSNEAAEARADKGGADARNS